MRIFIGLMITLSLTSFAYAKGLVVSTHPLYLIAQDVTKGVEQPTLILSKQHTGHDIHITPKVRQAINEADLILWLGEQHEAPLKRILNTIKKAVSLLDSQIMQTLPLRDVKGQVVANSVDTHIWLEPNNAVRIAFFIAALRSQQQPQHKDVYWKNAQDFSKRMFDATRIAINSSNDRHYWALHDAYQYLERPLQLKFAGSLSDDHHVAPSIAQIKQLNDHRPVEKMCLLAEFHIDQATITRLAPVNNVAVDESISTETDFVTAWLKLANSVQQCFTNI